jgi:TatD DNase family protein
MTDAHCHPWDLLEYLKNAEEERRETGTACAASSYSKQQFEYHESLAEKARQEGAPRLFCCFALHPQLSASFLEKDYSSEGDISLSSGLELLQSLGLQGRLDAVGETGFDLYDERYRAAEKIQDEMFAGHLETALTYGLPLVLHVRRAMHKIFPFAGDLKKLPAVVFHSWTGTSGDAKAMHTRGINAFFSFGKKKKQNHREAMSCAARFPAERILLETDAPYQPLRGKAFSSWRDLAPICRGIAALRKEAGSPGSTPEELEALTTDNFFRVFAVR